MKETDEEKEEGSGTQTSVRAKSFNARSVHCNGCDKEFDSEDDYLDHVYDNDACYREYLASDKERNGQRIVRIESERFPHQIGKT